MEDLLRAAALGIVQGLTEFLPISSSGHLIITRELFGWDFADDLTFDVALHLGTTLALLVFFWREWLLTRRRRPRSRSGLRLRRPFALPPAHRGGPGRHRRLHLR
ncbi:MAG: putative bacitracin resistance protein [Dehalococcoidia bacterium]|nr:putative bacitracin resistance protein [Dehalococcoidia bacterium]